MHDDMQQRRSNVELERVIPEPPCDREAALRSLEELLGSSQLTPTARTTLNLEEREVRHSVVYKYLIMTTAADKFN